MRRTIISTVCVAMAVVFAASCNKIEEDIVSVEGNGKTVINGVAEAIGGGTKAYNEYMYIVKWNEVDRIYVTNGTGDDTFTLTDGEDTPVGVFTEDNDKSISGNIEAFYPASLHTASGDYVWPATQSNNQVAPMYAKQSITGTENEVVCFSSLGGMLQIVFNTKTEDITVTSITLEHNKKPLSGKFTVDENGHAIMAENSENPGVTLDLGKSGVPVGIAAKYFYLAIPAGTYSTAEKDEVMTITFRDDVHHKECVMTSTTFPEVERNTVGRITLAKDFTLQKRTVKFDINKTDKTGGFIEPDDIKVEYGSTVAPAMPFAENYAFRGWYTDKDCTTPYDFSSMVTKDMTLYAKWAEDPTGTQINGHDYVKLAGYYWATENVISSGFNRVYHDDTYGDYFNQCFYTSEYFDATNNNALNAAKSWGSTWTLPSEAQWWALLDYCDWEWYENYNNTGKNGYLVKGRAGNYESGHSIFLPAAGFYSLNCSYDQGSFGYYWSADQETCLYLGNNDWGMSGNPSHYGLSVRPVSE